MSQPSPQGGHTEPSTGTPDRRVLLGANDDDESVTPSIQSPGLTISSCVRPSTTTTATAAATPSEFKLSRKRWFVLFAIAIFGLSLSLAGETASVFNLLLKLLDLEVNKYLYILQIFHYLILLIVGPTALFVDKFGIRATVHAAVCFFVLTGLFKSLLYLTQLPGWSTNKMYYFLASSLFGTQTYALFILLPLKVSETWFSVSERSIAWTILMLQFDVGVCIASFFYPRLIHTVDDFKLLAYIYIVLLSVTSITCVSCVTRSEPDNPPSVRMAEASRDNTPFMVSVKKMVKHRDILLHVIHGGVYGALLYSVGIVLQDILISIGLNAVFAGNYISINSFVAIVMLITMASFVHKVKNPLIACKLGSFAQATLFICHLATLKMAAPGWMIVGVAVCLTICRSCASPHFNDITAHMACGTVSQATVVGFSVLIGTLSMSVIQTSFAYLIQTDKHGKSDYNQSLMFVGMVCIINEAIYLLFFQGKSNAKMLTATDTIQGIENTAYEHNEAAR